jgi:alkyl sulfatase BDS1-like metallo-beta-lactamase superfamily hydrolase
VRLPRKPQTDDDPVSATRAFDTLTSLQGFLAENPDLTITINRSDLEDAMLGTRPLMEQVAAGTAVLDGDVGVLGSLAGMLVHFELGFEIMPGTGHSAPSGGADPFEQEPLADSAGG